MVMSDNSVYHIPTLNKIVVVLIFFVLSYANCSRQEMPSQSLKEMDMDVGEASLVRFNYEGRINLIFQPRYREVKIDLRNIELLAPNARIGRLFLIKPDIRIMLTGSVWAEDQPWQKVKDGLFVGKFQSPQKSKIAVKNTLIYIVKIDPNFYDLRLLCASEHDNTSRTAKEWCEEFGLLGAINACMYEGDYITSTGFMKNYGHVNNPNIYPKFGAIMAFNPLDSVKTKVPKIQIIDKYQQDWEELIKDYHTLIQNYRLITLSQENAWQPSDQIYSMVVVGIDENGNVLFIFSRAPYSGHDFANILLNIPISIRNAMYVEGGPAATLYFSTEGIVLDKVGSYETRYYESDNNKRTSPIPNVIGIVEKK